MRHSEAAQIITRAFQKVAGRDPTPSELSYCQAVGWLETFYGRGGPVREAPRGREGGPGRRS